MPTKKWSHLVKPLEVKEGPEGLYPAPRIWGGGKEWQDFQGHFSYGFLRKVGEVCHPVEGAVVHPYDEVLVCAGTNFENMLDLAGEMSIEIGEEREEHIFDKSQVICIPKGTPHGALKVRKIGDKPIAHYLWGLASEYRAEIIPERSRPAKPTTGTKYGHMVKVLRSYIDPAKKLDMIRKGMKPEDLAKMEAYYEEARKKALASGEGKSGGTGMGYEMLADESGIMRPNGVMGPGNADQLLWLFGEDLNDFDFNFLWTFASKPGVWHTMADGHYHPEPEVLIFVGFNPDDLLDLGARCEVHMGTEFEGHIFKKPTALIMPSGFVHLPEVTLNAERTYAFLVGCLSGTHEAPWVNMEDFED
jgi:hypothetical protein